MLRKVAVWTAVFLVLFTFSDTVWATEQNTEPMSVISAYCLDDTVYMAVRPGENDPGEMQVSLVLGGISNDVREQPDYVVAVKYVLLVDLSTSMPSYQKSLLSFADALLSEGTEGVTVTVAGFGECFEVLSEDISGKEQLRSALNALTYNHRATDICGGMVDALNYFSDGERREGEIVHLILLTDGIPYLTGDPELEEAAIEVSARGAADIVAETSEVVIHTVCFRDDWEEVTYSAVSSGKGLQMTAVNTRSAAEAGSKIGQFASSLYEMVFPVNWTFGNERMSAQLLISDSGSTDMSLVSVQNLRDISVPLAAEVAERPSIVNPESDDSAPRPSDESAEETETDGSSGENEVGEPSEAETAAGEVPREAETEQMISIVPDTETVDQEAGLPMRTIAIAAGAGILLVVLVIALILWKLRGRRMSKQTGIRLKLEVIAGQCKDDGKVFSLRDQLLIGSAKSCDVVFSDPSISDQSTRIFLKDQAVYIEDLNGRTNTSLGGMKIYAPNRLRSGDEIEIGNVCFRFWF